MLLACLRLELLLKARDLQALLVPAVFLLSFALLFPLALTPDGDLLKGFASGICWLAMLVSLMLHLDRIFRQDYEQGALDIYLAADLPGYAALVARLLVNWMVIGLPLCLLAVGLGAALGSGNLLLLGLSLASGSASLVFVGAIIASLCVSLARAGLLIGLLLLPLLSPVVIFGVQASQGQGSWQLALLLFGLACVNLVLSPLLCRAALLATLD